MARKKPKGRVFEPTARENAPLFSGRRVAIVLGALGLALAYHAFTVSFDILFATKNPALAAQVTGAPQARVRSWQIAAISEQRNLADSSIRGSALSAVVRNPLNAEALRALAFHEDHLGNTEEAEALALLSQRVTRRDELNQLILAQQKAREDDIPGAMDHLGIALTTSRRARDDIFALMVQLLSNEEFREALAGEVSVETDWMVPFFRYSIQAGGGNAEYLGEIMLASNASDARAVAGEVGPSLLSYIAQSGNARMTRDVFALQFPDRVNLLRDPRIAEPTSRRDMGWLGWQPVDDGATGAELGSTASGGFGVLAYTGSGENNTTVLRRIVHLPAGRYTLSESREELTGDNRMRFEWSVKCHNGSTWEQRPLDEQEGRVRFSIGSDCAMQLIELKAFAARNSMGGEIVIEDFRIARSQVGSQS